MDCQESIYAIRLERVSLSLNIYRVLRLNALRFPAFTARTLVFRLFFLFSLFFYAFCASTYILFVSRYRFPALRPSPTLFFHAKSNSLASSRTLQDYFLRVERAGWETTNVKPHRMFRWNGNGIVHEIDDVLIWKANEKFRWFAINLAILEILSKCLKFVSYKIKNFNTSDLKFS